MKKLPITVIILTDQSGSAFARAVKSVLWAEEVVIIDNNSGINRRKFNSDQFTIKQLPNPITNFASIRNQAMKDARHDWVLFLDSDEQLTKHVVPKLAAVIENQSLAGATLLRSDVFYGKKLEYGEAGHQPILRLMRKDQATWTGAVHETASITGNTVHINAEILHYAHSNIAEFIVDVSDYAQLVAKNYPAKNFWRNLLELLTFPLGKLLFGLFIQGGIIDGWRGVVYAFCMSLHSLLVRIYRYEQMAQTNQSATH